MEVGEGGPIKCSKCDATFDTQDQLNEHMRRDHSDDEVVPETGSTEGGTMQPGSEMNRS
jgi:hypothetical protein